MAESQTVQPQTGRVGAASWWITDEDEALVTVAISFGSTLREGGTALRIWAVLNGELVVLRRSDDDDAAWGLSTAVPLDGQPSLIVPLELDPTDLRPGLNTLTFMWNLPTSRGPVRLWINSFPPLNVFYERTGAAEIRSDNDAVSAQLSPRVAGGGSFVSLGPAPVGFEFFDGPHFDEIESEGIFVHTQVGDITWACADGNRAAIFVLLDDEPLPIGPEGQTSLILDIPSESSVTVRLPLPPLPRTPGHVLQIWEVGGIGYPYESDQDPGSYWYGSGGGLTQIFW
jgi:hypothetical protein